MSDLIEWNISHGLKRWAFASKQKDGASASEWLEELRTLEQHLVDAVAAAPGAWAAQLGMTSAEVSLLYEPAIVGSLSHGNTVSVVPRLTDEGRTRLIQSAAAMGISLSAVT